MYDYVEGKVEWMAYGRPVDGDRGPYVGSALRSVRTCAPDDDPSKLEFPAVVVADRGIAIGVVEKASAATALDAMDPVPDTIRPSVPLADIDERAAGHLVTTPDGVLLGAVDPKAVSLDE